MLVMDRLILADKEKIKLKIKNTLESEESKSPGKEIKTKQSASAGEHVKRKNDSGGKSPEVGKKRATSARSDISDYNPRSPGRNAKSPQPKIPKSRGS